MAKNLVTFQPGSGRSQSEGANPWCQMTFTTGNGCHSYGPGPRDPNYGSNQANWTVPTGVTKAEFYIRSSGNSSGGTCCCMRGSPGNSGMSAVICPTMTVGDEWQFCMSAGGCCIADVNGQQACYLRVYNRTVNGASGCEYLHLSGASCSGSFCNWGTCCNVSGQTRFDTACGAFTCAKDWHSKKNFDNTSRFTCKNCMKYSGTSHTALTDGTLDSDVDMFQSRSGFTIMPCSGASTLGAACAIQHVVPIQHFDTTKSHYVAAPANFTANWTGSGADCNYLTLWSRGVNAYGRAGAICAGGMGPLVGGSEGGNCYCGGSGGQAVVTIRYK